MGSLYFCIGGFSILAWVGGFREMLKDLREIKVTTSGLERLPADDAVNHEPSDSATHPPSQLNPSSSPALTWLP